MNKKTLAKGNALQIKLQNMHTKADGLLNACQFVKEHPEPESEPRNFTFNKFSFTFNKKVDAVNNHSFLLNPDEVKFSQETRARINEELRYCLLRITDLMQREIDLTQKEFDELQIMDD